MVTANLRNAAATSYAEMLDALVALNGSYRTIFCVQEVTNWPGSETTHNSEHESTLASISFAGYVCYRIAGRSTAVILHDTLVEHVVKWDSREHFTFVALRSLFVALRIIPVLLQRGSWLFCGQQLVK